MPEKFRCRVSFGKMSAHRLFQSRFQSKAAHSSHPSRNLGSRRDLLEQGEVSLKCRGIVNVQLTATNQRCKHFGVELVVFKPLGKAVDHTPNLLDGFLMVP